MNSATSRILLLLVGLLLCSCGQEEPAQSERPTGFSTPADAADYRHPLYRAPDRLLIPGCCSLDTADSSVEELFGDVAGRSIKGHGFEVEVSFGAGVAPLAAEFRVKDRTIIDGVEIERLSASPGARAVRATVPFSQQAESRNVARPVLQAVAHCTDRRGCAKADEILQSIRF